MILEESAVVAAAEGHQPLQFVIAPTYLLHHIVEPRLSYQLVIFGQGQAAGAALIAPTLRIHCNKVVHA